MSDLIRREDALDAVNDCGICIQKILDIPSAEPEQKWIPVSEALPENNDKVLTTYIVNGNKKKRYVETASYFDGDWSSPLDEYMVLGTDKEVLAWMPLIEPWRGEK